MAASMSSSPTRASRGPTSSSPMSAPTTSCLCSRPTRSGKALLNPRTRTHRHSIVTALPRETDRVSSSVFLAAKYAAPAMGKTSADKPTPGGSIIGTASVAGIRSNAGSTPYSASKAAVVSLAQTLAYQLAGTGVRVNAVCPGLIETGMTAPVYQAARARGSEKKIGQLNPTKRGGHADEIARVALFLGSDESSYVNGQAWAVDGGLSAGHPYVPGRLG